MKTHTYVYVDHHPIGTLVVCPNWNGTDHGHHIGDEILYIGLPGANYTWLEFDGQVCDLHPSFLHSDDLLFSSSDEEP